MLITDAFGDPVELDELDPAGVLSVLEGQVTRGRGVERDKLLTAAQWCVLHPATADTGRLSLVEGNPIVGGPEALVADEPLGGEGTPAVAAFTVEPFAAKLRISTRAGKALLADALDLAHRLPRTWARVLALEVEPFKARRVAQLTNPLSQAAAADVDAEVAPRLASCSWAAVERAVAAAIAEHHPELIRDQERQGKAGWDVTLGHPGPADYAGTSWLAASGDTLDLDEFYARITGIAADLRAAGDTDELGARKAKALGILAQVDQQTGVAELVEARAAQTADPDSAGPVAPDRRPERTPQTRLYLHLSLSEALVLTGQPTADVERAPTVGVAERLGPVTVDTVRDWVRRSQVTVTPVLDLDPAVDEADAPEESSGELRERLDALSQEPIRDWVGHPEARVRPVLDLAGARAVDGYGVPEDIREQVILRDGRCVFPYCSAHARNADLDHTDAYVPPDEGGPPGQTNAHNLAPLCRRHHRCKTARRWRYRRRPDRAYEWHGPYGLAYLVTHDHTAPLAGS